MVPSLSSGHWTEILSHPTTIPKHQWAKIGNQTFGLSDSANEALPNCCDDDGLYLCFRDGGGETYPASEGYREAKLQAP